MEPIVRALDVGFGHTKFVSGMDGSEVRCAHFPSVAYPTESDETTDPMGGRRKTVGIPIDGLIYEVGHRMNQVPRLHKRLVAHDDARPTEHRRLLDASTTRHPRLALELARYRSDRGPAGPIN